MKMNTTINEVQFPTILIIYLALTTTLFIYGGVAFFVISQGGEPVSSEAGYANLFKAFLPVSVIFGLVSLKFHSMKKKAQNQSEYLTYTIITLALNEAIAIFGFVLTFLSYEMNYYLGFASAALFLNLLMKPNKQEFLSIGQ